jgi:outer membrane usher protein
MGSWRKRIGGRVARLALIFGFAAHAPALAQSPAEMTDAGFDINLPIRQDGRTIGVSNTRIYRDGSVALRAESLRTLLGDGLTRNAVDALIGAAGEDGLLSQAEAATQGFVLRYDPAELVVDIEVPLSARPDRSVRLGRRATGANEDQFAKPAAFSAYLNVFAGYAASEDHSEGANVLLEGAGRLGGVVFETAFTYDESETGTFDRNYARLIYDDIDNGMRYSAGDIVLPSVGFQPTASLIGISASRRELFAKLYSGSAAQTSERFTLERGSTVKVMVNGEPVQTLRLGPGTYDLANIPIGNTGLNAVELVATDDTGQSQTFRFDRFFDDRMLGVGVWDFGVAIGTPTSIGSFQKPETNSGIAGSAFFLAGVAPNLTVGANIGGDERLQVAGVEGVMTTQIGAFGGDAGYSHSDVGEGFGFELDYQAYLPESLKRRDAVLNLSLRSYSETFLSTEVGQRQSTAAEISARYSQRIGEAIFGSMGAYHAWSRGPSPNRWGAYLGVSQSFANNLTWSATANYETDASGRSDLHALLSLSVRWDRNLSSRATHNTRDNRSTATTAYVSPQLGVGAWSAEVGVERSDATATALTAGAAYQANRFEVRAQSLQGLETTSGERASRAQILMGTSFALADGMFGIGRPIRDAFALVDTHETLRGHDAYVDRQRNGESFQSRKDALGPALVSSLGSYTTRRLTYDVADLPPGYNLGAGLFIVDPPYRSGYALFIGSAYTVTGLGRLVDDAGAPVTYALGRIEAIGDPEFSSAEFFTNATGRFGIQGLKPGERYRVILPGKNMVIELKVPAEADGMVNWNDLKVVEGEQ